MQLPFLTEAELRRRIDMPRAIEAMRSAFVQMSDGRADVPIRTSIEGGGTTALFMPGWLPAEGALGAKVVTVRPENAEAGRPVVQAVLLLVDPATGAPSALLEGTWLTALRTGAASGLATDLLALPDADVLAVVGAGAQAFTQIEAVLAVRPIREVRIRSLSRASSEALIERCVSELTPTQEIEWRVEDDAEAQLRGARVVVTATNAVDPVLPENGVEPGTHVNAVGAYTPTMRELPSGLVRDARVIVDQVEAAWAEAGDLILARSEEVIEDDHVAAELGELVAGLKPGRTNGEEITVFKSVGSAAQDLAVARAALEAGG